MISTKRLLLGLAVLGWLTIISIPASAELFFDFHVGPAFPQKDKDAVESLGVGKVDLEVDNAVSFGPRLGYYFDPWPYLGLAVDVSHYRPGARLEGVSRTTLDFDKKVTAVSFDAILRWPLLVSKDFPKGQIQPYVTVGPGVYHVRSKMKAPIPILLGSDEDSDTVAGGKVGIGVPFLVHRNLGFFAEYRFSWFSPKLFPGFRDADPVIRVGDIDVRTHRVIFGISFRFP